MNKNKFVQAVLPSKDPIKYPTPLHNDPLELTAELKKTGIEILLGNTLKGGTISQVYETEFEGKAVVVKHTSDLAPFDPTEFFISKEGHNVDTKVLRLLANSSIRVPKVVRHFPDIATTIMEDVRASGFELLGSMMIEGKLPQNSAAKVGKAIAELAIESRKWEDFETNESAEQSIYERGFELREMYPNSQSQYLELERAFTADKKSWMWPDGHPKNVFVNEDGDPLFIDFGRSVFGDQRYMLPNFLAHIAIYSIAGYYATDLAVEYIQAAIKGYREIEEIKEALFCKYFGMEVLHRAFGKYMSGIERKEQKMALANFGLTVFDENIDNVEELMKLIIG